MTDKQPAELPEPCVGAFDDPATLVAPELSAVFVLSFLAVLAVWNDEIDASLLEPLAQRIGVVGPDRRSRASASVADDLWGGGP